MRTPTTVTLVLVLVALPAVLTSCSGQAAVPARPHLVMLMLDAARADLFSSYGHPLPTTPNMDALAQSGLRFAQHFSHSNNTRQSLPQLFTSRYDAPSLLLYAPQAQDAWWKRDELLQEDAAFLPTVLGEAGYRTVMVTAHPWTVGSSKFGQAFQEVIFVPPGRAHYATASALVRRSRRVLKDHRSQAERPLFLYVHFLDSHTPHNPAEDDLFSLSALGWSSKEWAQKQPAKRGRKFIADASPELLEAYLGAVRSSMRGLDKEVGRLLQSLKSSLGAKTIVTVTSDHGDALGEGGHFEHGSSTFGIKALHHIPWILSGPGVPGGGVEEGFTESVDVMPTLLDLLGVAPPPSALLDGTSMVRLPAGGTIKRPGVPMTFRTGSQQTRLGYLSETATVLATEQDEVFQTKEGALHRLGNLPGVASSLPRDFLRFIRTYRQREQGRKFRLDSRALLVPAAEFLLDDSGPPGCWEAGKPLDLRAQVVFASRPASLDETNGSKCGPLRVTISMPRGRYQARWQIRAIGPEAKPRIRFRHSQGEVLVEDRSGSITVDLGEIQHPGGAWTGSVAVESGGMGLSLSLGAMNWLRLGVDAEDLEQQPDSDLIEQLKGLGYLN